jgi:hypothetical protein
MDSAVQRLQNIERQIISRRLERHLYFLVKPVPLPLDYSAHTISHNDYAKLGYLGDKHGEEESAGIIMTMEPAQSSRDPEFLNKTAEATWSIDEIDSSGAVWLGACYASRLNMQYLDLWLTSMLDHLAYFNGSLKMRAQLGTCVFTKYKRAENAEYSLAAFEDLLLERNVQENELEAYATTEYVLYAYRIIHH